MAPLAIASSCRTMNNIIIQNLLSNHHPTVCIILPEVNELLLYIHL